MRGGAHYPGPDPRPRADPIVRRHSGVCPRFSTPTTLLTRHGETSLPRRGSRTAAHPLQHRYLSAALANRREEGLSDHAGLFLVMGGGGGSVMARMSTRRRTGGKALLAVLAAPPTK
jgi:hypothetical protein